VLGQWHHIASTRDTGDGHPRTVCAAPAPQTPLFYLLMCSINVKACFVGTETSANASLQLICTADCWKAVSARMSPNMRPACILRWCRHRDQCRCLRYGFCWHDSITAIN